MAHNGGMRRRALAVVVLIGMLFAACGSGQDSGQGSTSQGTTGQDTTPSPGTDGPGAPTEPADAPATSVSIADVQPALGIDASAGDQFSGAGRAGGDRSGFVVLDDPPMVSAADVTWLTGDDVVLGIVGPNGETQAFPANQIAYHHIANTTVAGEPYLVTY